ncbi:MAG TPA: HD domain-containing protein [Candidatus Dormibacteraeota bacterium]|nr:HD domain-containing protein [Candidatus Dormibacteraeota bacterium]
MAHPRFEALNLISDPIHGYLELTKRLSSSQSQQLDLLPEAVAEEDLLDTPWMQRLRRISQLQSARWVFPTAEHSRFTHGLGVMHEAGLWGRALYPTLRETLLADTLAEGEASEHPIPSEGLVVETLRVAGLLHDVGHGPFAHFFDDHVLARFPAPAHPSRDPAKRLSHEDLGQAIVERELADLIGGLRRAPSSEPSVGAFAEGEAIEPGWISFLISKPPLADPAMPLWVRRLQPLFSGVFTVDNLDYVRRDAYLTGVATGPIDADRLRRYAFITPRGLALYEPGLGALEMFLTARLFLYNTIYFHRTVRAIDLDLAEVFAPSIAALFGEHDPLEALSAYADLDEYALLHQASRWARGEELAQAPRAGDGRVTPQVGGLWRGILLRQPTWRVVREVRRDSRGGHDRASVEAELRAALGGEADRADVRLDLAEADARPQNPLAAAGQLIIARRDGTLDPTGLGELLERLPAVVVVGRAYRRASTIA